LIFFAIHLAKFHLATNNGRIIPKGKIMNNNDEIYLNDVIMEEEKMEEKFETQPSLQIEESINANEGENRIKENF
jgi:hypothetical protein